MLADRLLRSPDGWEHCHLMAAPRESAPAAPSRAAGRTRNGVASREETQLPHLHFAARRNHTVVMLVDITSLFLAAWEGEAEREEGGGEGRGGEG